MKHGDELNFAMQKSSPSSVSGMTATVHDVDFNARAEGAAYVPAVTFGS